MVARDTTMWDVVLQGDDGQTYEHKFQTFWRPDFADEKSAEIVAKSCAAMKYVATGKTQKYVGISASLAS